MGVSRDSYYKHFSRLEDKAKQFSSVLCLVRSSRIEQPRRGCKKLYQELKPALEKTRIKLGRDRFIELVVNNDLHVKRRKKYVRTTYSKHDYAVAPNRIKDLTVERPNQVFVSDITYLRILGGFIYLFLVTDLFSRKIMGYDLREDLSHEGAIKALKMANTDLEDSNEIITHSDRGSQYCCHEFLKFAKSNGFITSMTDESHCYQNAVAERVNGILKDEFFLDLTFKNFSDARKAVEDAIRIYNTKRLHWSLKLRTPEQVYSHNLLKLAA